MDVSSWYSFICATILALWLLAYGICRAFKSKWPLTTTFFRRHLLYPHIFPRIPFIGTATRAEFLMVSLYLLANTLIIVIGPSAQMSSRASTMSIINLIPLFCGPRLSLVTKLLGISLRASVGSHQWLGRTAIAQMIWHMVIVLTGNSRFAWTAINLNGVVVGFAFAFMRTLADRNRRALLSDSSFSSRFTF